MVLISRQGEGTIGWPTSGTSIWAVRVSPRSLRKSCWAAVPDSMAICTVPMLLE